MTVSIAPIVASSRAMSGLRRDVSFFDLPPCTAIAGPHSLDAHRCALLYGLFRYGIVLPGHQVVRGLVPVELTVVERDEDRAAADDVTDASGPFDVRPARDHAHDVAVGDAEAFRIGFVHRYEDAGG